MNTLTPEQIALIYQNVADEWDMETNYAAVVQMGMMTIKEWQRLLCVEPLTDKSQRRLRSGKVSRKSEEDASTCWRSSFHGN
jgi:hypothetical protein